MPPINSDFYRLLCNSLVGLLFLTSTTVFAKAVPERADIDAEFKWDLTDMYADATAWEADQERFLEALPTLSAHRGKLGESGANLLQAIESIQTVETIIANLYVYAGLKSYEDTRISENAARFSEAQGMYSQYQQALAYFTPELLAIPEETLTQFIERTPGLEVYAHYLDETARMRPYTLSEAEERLLAMASDPLDKFDSVFTAIDSSDLSFGTMIDESGDEVELTNSRYGAFLHSTDRDVREAAWKGLFEGYKTLNHTLAANYEGHVKSRVFFARARGFESRLEHATYTFAIAKDEREMFSGELTKYSLRPCSYTDCNFS